MSKSSQKKTQLKRMIARHEKRLERVDEDAQTVERLIRECPLCFPTTKLFFQNQHWQAWRELIPGDSSATQIIVASRQHWDLFQMIRSQPGVVEAWFDALCAVALASGSPNARLEMPIVMTLPRADDSRFRGQFFHVYAIVTPTTELRGVKVPRRRPLDELVRRETKEIPPTKLGSKKFSSVCDSSPTDELDDNLVD